MPANLKKLFWENGIGRLTPHTIPAHKEVCLQELSKLSISHPEIVEEIEAFYKLSLADEVEAIQSKKVVEKPKEIIEEPEVIEEPKEVEAVEAVVIEEVDEADEELVDAEEGELTIDEVNENLKELGVEVHPRTGEAKRRKMLEEALSTPE